MTDKIKEAAEKYAFRVPYDGSNNFYNEDRYKGFVDGATSEAAREYWDAAREDEAVGFAEWVADNNKHKYRAGWGDMTGKDIRYYTTKQLYQLYQKSKQKQAITDIMNDDERDGLYDDKNQNL